MPEVISLAIIMRNSSGVSFFQNPALYDHLMRIAVAGIDIYMIFCP
jgi:uncharacterized protein (DUF486 family)